MFECCCSGVDEALHLPVLCLNAVVQVLQFHVFDWDVKVSDPSQQDKLGHCEVTLAQIMANGGAPLTVTLVGGGGATISILGEELSLSKVRAANYHSLFLLLVFNVIYFVIYICMFW